MTARPTGTAAIARSSAAVRWQADGLFRLLARYGFSTEPAVTLAVKTSVACCCAQYGAGCSLPAYRPRQRWNSPQAMATASPWQRPIALARSRSRVKVVRWRSSRPSSKNVVRSADSVCSAERICGVAPDTSGLVDLADMTKGGRKRGA